MQSIAPDGTPKKVMMPDFALKGHHTNEQTSLEVFLLTDLSFPLNPSLSLSLFLSILNVAMARRDT